MNMGREKVDLIQTPYIIHSASLTSAALQVSCFPHSRWHSSQIEPPLRRHAKLYLHGERQHCRDDRVTQHHWDLHSHTSSLWFIYRTTSSFFSPPRACFRRHQLCVLQWVGVRLRVLKYSCRRVGAFPCLRRNSDTGTACPTPPLSIILSSTQGLREGGVGRWEEEEERRRGGLRYPSKFKQTFEDNCKKKHKKRREKPRWEMAHCVLPLLFTQH